MRGLRIGHVPAPDIGNTSVSWTSSPTQGGAVNLTAFAHSGSPSIGGSAKVSDSGTTSPQTTAGVTTQASGSTFVVDVIMTSLYLQSVTDNKGNTYTLDSTVANYSGDFDLLRYICANGTGGAGHTVSITKTGGAETAEVTAFFVELVGVGAKIGSTVGTVDATDPITSPNLNVTGPRALLLSAMAGDRFDQNFTQTATNYTVIQEEKAVTGVNAQGAVAYRVLP